MFFNEFYILFITVVIMLLLMYCGIYLYSTTVKQFRKHAIGVNQSFSPIGSFSTNGSESELPTFTTAIQPRSDN